MAGFCRILCVFATFNRGTIVTWMRGLMHLCTHTYTYFHILAQGTAHNRKQLAATLRYDLASYINGAAKVLNENEKFFNNSIVIC